MWLPIIDADGRERSVDVNPERITSIDLDRRIVWMKRRRRLTLAPGFDLSRLARVIKPNLARGLEAFAPAGTGTDSTAPPIGGFPAARPGRLDCFQAPGARSGENAADAPEAQL